jgi:hypothetical protein
MDVKVLPTPHSITPAESLAATRPERVEDSLLQEQASGPIPLRDERPAADIITERLTTSDPASPPLVFVP